MYQVWKGNLKDYKSKITRYQQARNEEGKFISQEQYNSVRNRNKKLSDKAPKLRSENSEMIYKVMCWTKTCKTKKQSGTCC